MNVSGQDSLVERHVCCGVFGAVRGTQDGRAKRGKRCERGRGRPRMRTRRPRIGPSCKGKRRRCSGADGVRLSAIRAPLPYNDRASAKTGQLRLTTAWRLCTFPGGSSHDVPCGGGERRYGHAERCGAESSPVYLPTRALSGLLIGGILAIGAASVWYMLGHTDLPGLITDSDDAWAGMTTDEYLAALRERRPIIRSDFDVYLVEYRRYASLIYVKEQCTWADVDTARDPAGLERGGTTVQIANVTVAVAGPWMWRAGRGGRGRCREGCGARGPGGVRLRHARGRSARLSEQCGAGMRGTATVRSGGAAAAPSALASRHAAFSAAATAVDIPTRHASGLPYAGRYELYTAIAAGPLRDWSPGASSTSAGFRGSAGLGLPVVYTLRGTGRRVMVLSGWGRCPACGPAVLPRTTRVGA